MLSTILQLSTLIFDTFYWIKVLRTKSNIDFLANAAWGAFGGAVVQTITNGPLFRKSKRGNEKIDDGLWNERQVNGVEERHEQVNVNDIQEMR